jgi:hypothetical protein
MSTRKRTRQNGRGRRHRISVRGVRRSAPDTRKLSQAVIDLAIAQAEADAEADRKRRDREVSSD